MEQKENYRRGFEIGRNLALKNPKAAREHQDGLKRAIEAAGHSDARDWVYENSRALLDGIESILKDVD
ncbi:hypothetical protein [Desulfuromonas sp. AOP6]|uniref:hypothetical protein n=1 Tax=Desulfuromonas sp. AOP6 TaxID=1566351 RepID=UPI001283C6DD|nr:hypothetical protein [Desulfuromonas sp. AOP6]BCA80303.1 hypothetical protein AOP6_2090 [Desulfuromonas sp. AOP6]